MGSDGIYRKTEKGRAEVATRANKLGLRERTMLIMVDDKTTRRGLLEKNTHPTSEGILNDLLAGGYIETTPGTGGAPPEMPAEAAPEPPSLPAVEVSLKSASSYACRALVAYLGPSADDLTALIEKCKGLDDLTDRLQKCRDVIQAMAGRKKADEFWFSVSARLPKA
ncbi:MAG: hypothetical protein HZA63_05715 [Rhodocyclales bacterium]|nr:hypothetical protein [Rhodocyclales bacterium]